MSSFVRTTMARRRRRATISCELLESRRVLAPLVGDVLTGTLDTVVTGTIYHDLNANGVKDNGDDGLQSWRVYVDLDGSGTYNTDAVGAWEPSGFTNVDGDFAIRRLIAGTYRIAEVLQPGWTPTAAVSREVVITRNQETKTSFFNFGGGSIEGTVWSDFDRDGIRAFDDATATFTEPGLAGWTMFLDVNRDNALDAGDPVTTTDADGRFRFERLAAGDYEVYQVAPDGWGPTIGSDVHQTVAVSPLLTSTQDFGNFSSTSGALRGTLWSDQNFNGVRDSNPVTGEWADPGLAGWTVYIDLDEDGALTEGEPTALTNEDGQYVFPSLSAGTYLVSVVLQERWNVVDGSSSSWFVNVDAGVTTDAPDFAVFTALNGTVSGTIWNDRFRDGSRDVDLTGAFLDPGLAGWTVFLDRNRNGTLDTGEPTATTDAAGAYTFPDLQVGDYEVFEVVPSGWEPTVGYAVSQTVTVVSGATTTAGDFANFNLTSTLPGSVSGTVWNDANGNGIRDVGALGVFSDSGLSGRTVFADVNANGVQDIGEPVATTTVDGSYTISGVTPGTVAIVVQTTSGWSPTNPSTGARTVTVRNGGTLTGVDFGSYAIQKGVLSGTVFHDADGDGIRGTGEAGIAGLTVYLDLNDNGVLDVGEPRTVTSEDKFFTPTVDEAGTWEFTHLAAGTHVVRVQVSDALSATPAAGLRFSAMLTGVDSRTGLDTPGRYRLSEIRGTRYDDADGDGIRDPGETPVAGATLFLDLDRDNVQDPGEPTTTTGSDGSYAFTGLSSGAYVVRDVVDGSHEHSSPGTLGGTLWPSGTSNPAVGAVSPTSITASLASGESLRRSVSLTLPGSGALTNVVDVFLLFDDTGSFTWNSPIVRGAFPTIIDTLNVSLPGVDLGFGVGRFEEYGNHAWEYSTGRPFILNQPIVAASTTGYMAAIQAALDRTTPGYGGDAPETDIEALYQLVTGLGFDGNNNGSVLDSGAAGLVSTQLNPGASGDVPSFASFVADTANGALPAAGTVGGGGFRAGALPIVLLATDVGFAYQPKGETVVTGVGGLSLPVSALTQDSRPTTPFNAGAGLQETITALNALGALVIGLGTNAQPNLDPRQGLEAISKLTGAINRSTTTIANGTVDPIAPGDPLYFQIASGFATSVANGVVNAIQNAVTQVAVDLTVRASDPRVRIINRTGVVTSVGAGQTATFDIEFVGDGLPHRFDLQFVRNGTGVVMGSIPVVLGTPVPGNGYAFEDCLPGEVHASVDFGVRALSAGPVTGPTLSLTGAALTSVTTTYGSSSTATSTTIAGASLTGDVTATAPAGFEVTSDGTTYGSTAVFTVSGGAFTGALGVRLAATTAAGTYVGDVTVSGGGAANLVITVASSSVSPKSLTITGLSAVSREYDGTTAATLSGTAAYAGLVNGESFAIAGTPNATFANKNVGTGKTVTVSGYAAPSGNYTVTQPTGLTADISAKALSITGAAATSRVYDGTTTAAVTGGSLVGVITDDAVSLGGTPTGTLTDKNVGTGKSVTASGFALLGADAGNYSLAQPTGLTANITAKTLTVTAANRSRTYGSGNPSFTATITGFVSGETRSTALTGSPRVTTSATASSPVGTYPLVAEVYTLVANNGNYVFTFVNGTLTVTKANLRVVIDNKTKAAGQLDPTFTYGVLGLVNGDAAAGVIQGAAARTAGESVGTYAISKGTLGLKAGGAAGNYNTPTFTNGTLTIVAAAKPLAAIGAFVRGSGWADNYLGLSSFSTASGGTRLGYALGDGANQLVNSMLVTWNNVDRISVRFSEPINNPGTNSLSLLAVTGTGVGTQSTIPAAAAPTLTEGNTVATWAVSSLATGKYTLILRSTAITSAATGGQLDGEWTTSSSTFAAGSGNGTAGGDFRFRFNLIVGDVNTSGTVASTDYSAVTTNVNASVTTSNFRSDVNGSGTIVGTDATAVSGAIGKNLPTGNEAPVVTAASGATVDNAFDVTFTDDTTWRDAITGIRVGSTTANATAIAGAAWSRSAGRITLDPALATQLQTSGTKAVLISATGYADVLVSQALGAGLATKLGITTQPVGPASNGGTLATAPVVRIQDKYGNTVTTSTAQVAAAVEAGTGDWTLGGTTTRNASSGTVTFSGLTATRAGAPVSGAKIRFTSGSLTLVVSAGFAIP